MHKLQVNESGCGLYSIGSQTTTTAAEILAPVSIETFSLESLNNKLNSFEPLFA